MNELEIISKLSLQGEERAKVLQKIHQTVLSWGLTLPDVSPDLLHFGYHDFNKIGETEFNINNNVEHGYCGKFMFMFTGQTCPMHHHRIKHETFLIIKGTVDMTLAGNKFLLKQGDRLIVDQNVRHMFTALEDSLILESSKPDLVDDSIFQDQMINKIIFGKEEY
jgi:mannose-6-phosphate isomerase-like protein (cupin superfamily)